MDMQTWSDLNSAMWCEINPRRCPCNGRGWLLSDWDTWHRCLAHAAPNAKNPECQDDVDPATYRAQQLAMFRKAYVTFRDIALRNGIESASQFTALCRERLKTSKPSPGDWVDAAEEVAYDYHSPGDLE